MGVGWDGGVAILVLASRYNKLELSAEIDRPPDTSLISNLHIHFILQFS